MLFADEGKEGLFIGFRELNLGRNCKNYFRVYACCFVNISTVTYFNLYLCPFKQRDMSVVTRVPNFILREIISLSKTILQPVG